MAVSTVFRSLYFSTTSGAMIHMQMALARRSSNQTNGSLRRNFTVERSTTSTRSTDSSNWRSGLPSMVRKRSKENLTSSATSSRPLTGGLLCHLTPLRRWKIEVVSSGDSQRSARSGSTMKVPGGTSGPTLCRRSLLYVLLTQFGNYLSNYMISLVQKIDIANLGEIYHLDPSGGSRHA